jgi:hypothetical protein
MTEKEVFKKVMALAEEIQLLVNNLQSNESAGVIWEDANFIINEALFAVEPENTDAPL